MIKLLKYLFQMFQVRGSILRVVKLVLGVFTQYIPDIFHKSSIIAAIVTEKNIKLFQEYDNIWPFFINMLAFVLCLASTYSVSKKRCRKLYAIVSVRSSRIKMIFALLAEAIVI